MAEGGDALAILSLLGVQGVGPAKVTRLLALARQRGLSLQELIEDPEHLSESVKLEQLQGFQDARERASAVSAKVDEIGGSLLAATDGRYPVGMYRCLGRTAPPLLTVLGNAGLLETAGVGFCGSRAASERGVSVASDCAEQLAAAGVTVVSGFAAGVDMAAHEAALRAGGTTTVVLAEGLLKFRVKQQIREVWDPERTVVVSEFAPDAVWNVHNAMRRNRTICGLSHAMVLIEARAKGGSLEAGRACLDLGIPLFAAVYQGIPESAEGNRKLLKDGAYPLLKSRSLDRANVVPILDAIRTREQGSDTILRLQAR